MLDLSNVHLPYCLELIDHIRQQLRLCPCWYSIEHINCLDPDCDPDKDCGCLSFLPISIIFSNNTKFNLENYTCKKNIN